MRDNQQAFKYNDANKLPYDLIIIDEASMIDIDLFSSLLNAVSINSKLILLGDSAQLPSVNAGAIFTDLVPSNIRPIYSDEIIQKFPGIEYLPSSYIEHKRLEDQVVVLTHQYRSKAGVHTVATSIRDGEMSQIQDIDILQNLPTDDGVYWIGDESTLNIDSFARWYTDEYYSQSNLSENKGYERTLKSKILTVNRDGIYGASGINKKVSQLFGVKQGTPIMVSRNIYKVELFNGDTGVISFENGISVGVFYDNFENDVRKVIPLRKIDSYDIAFAITVHKSQGSEYDDVFVILPPEDSPLLTREILYTAITRAKKRVFIYGQNRLLKTIVSREVNRYSGLDFTDKSGSLC